MTSPKGLPAVRRAAGVAAAETWFLDRGLPWFVDRYDERVRALLAPRRLAPVLSGAGVLAFAAGVGLAFPFRPSAGVLAAAVVALLVLGAYAGGALRVATMARWAVGRIYRELHLLLPLVTRALPLLLLFMTFLFINTEVWQVASSLSPDLLWTAVLLFAGVAIMFLLTRLPAEVRRVEARAAAEGVARNCLGTPMESLAEELDTGAPARAADVPDPLTITQRANLVLVLLVAQVLQVLMLSAAVFAFFLLFGVVAMTDDVIASWVGHEPQYRALSVADVVVQLPVSHELSQVSVFLSAFAGLYFTVYAVSDPTYREEFFAELATELEQAVGVRAVYRRLLGHAGPGGGAAQRADS